MALPKELKEKLEKFLKNRKSSDGGWAPVDEDEVGQFVELAYAILEAKYERDPDGDLPVSVHVTDRTRYEAPLILPIPHLWDERRGPPDLTAVHDAMSSCLLVSKSYSERAATLMQLLRGEIRQTVDREGPIHLHGKEYRNVPTPNPGVELSEEWLTTRARQVFRKEESRNPCPSDWARRNTWATTLVNKLREAWGVFVALEACRITTRGVSVSLSVPAINQTLRFDTGGADAT